MATKRRLTVAPKKPAVSLKKVSIDELSRESDKANKKRLYKPRVRLTAHIKKTVR